MIYRALIETVDVKKNTPLGFFRMKKGFFLIVKSHLQKKHVETLEDTAYVHCVRYLAATSSMRPVWLEQLSKKKGSKKKKPYLFTLVKQKKSLQTAIFFFLNYTHFASYNKYESSKHLLKWTHTQREKKKDKFKEQWQHVQLCVSTWKPVWVRLNFHWTTPQ